MSRSYTAGSRVYVSHRIDVPYSPSDYYRGRVTVTRQNGGPTGRDQLGYPTLCTDPAAPAAWRVDWLGHRAVVATTPAEVVAAVAEFRRQAKEQLGREACQRLWSQMCDHYSELTRQAATVADLLWGDYHRDVFRAAAAGKTTSAEIEVGATRKVAKAAVAFARERLARRAAKKVAEAARTPDADRIPRLLAAIRAGRATKARNKSRKALLDGKLGRSAVAALVAAKAHFDAWSLDADALIRCVVRSVGTIGEQVDRDLAEMLTGEDFSGKRGRNHKLEGTVIERIEHRADWSAALVTLRDYRSFGSSRFGSGDRTYGSVGGSSFRCYLVVRDTTSGEAHVLRVAPKFGNSQTQFFGRFRQTPDYGRKFAAMGQREAYYSRLTQKETDARIEAARASTFAVGAEIMAAAVEA